MLWGDARQTLLELLQERRGAVDLIWHDAFSPRRCPQLWTVELLGTAAALLAPEGRWISYSSAAAVRETLRLHGLHLVALDIQETVLSSAAGIAGGAPARRKVWSGGTVASPSELGDRAPGAQSIGAEFLWVKSPGAKSLEAQSIGAECLWMKFPEAKSPEVKPPEVKPPEAKSLWRELTGMERDHLASAAGEPYRDPSGSGEAATILASRLAAQEEALASGRRLSSSAWRRRWGVDKAK
jgi:tRNA U34 5-methylaminomethyl-2-thiouridine-forming methyltransferase MnmC